MKRLSIVLLIGLLGAVILASSGCGNTEAKAPAPQPLQVNTQTVSLAPVPRVDEYVATVKSRRSASIQPQVDGSITRILVKSGDHVRAGQVLITIDPLKQQATVDQQRQHRGAEKGYAGLQPARSRAPGEVVWGRSQQQAGLSTCRPGIRKFQG